MKYSAVLAFSVLALSLPAQDAPPAKAPPDPLDGPPFVAAKAWAISDAKTGEFLWGAQEGEVLAMASTTKIMCALLVMKLAAADPAVLEEVVDVSAFSAATRGSSARLQEGDKLPVSELLYGLLLPSGNDAANVVAEHFGHHFAAPEEGQAATAPDRAGGPNAGWFNFMAEMNREAARLGMEQTHFENPEGLDAEGHHSTARDMLRLGLAAYQHEAMRERIGTRQRVYDIRTADGGTRKATWNNTNQLLGVEGYFGMKTGTTRNAGSCLVSVGRRGDRELMMVVLNSSNGVGRYVDSRNLYRWAWNELAKQKQ